MSDYEHKKGRIRPCERLKEETDENYFKRVLIEKKWVEDYWDEDDPIGIIYNLNLEDKYFYLNENIYEVLEMEDLDPYDTIKVLNEQSDGTYTFEMRWYNGGGSLGELLEDNLTKIVRKSNK